MTKNIEADFFEGVKEQSVVKANIVAKYFEAWAKVIISSIKRYNHPQKLLYIDLFSGPGRYADGSKSTPIFILETAVQDPEMCKMLITIFNDTNENYANSLRKEINNIPGIEKLHFKPEVSCEEVGPNLVNRLQKVNLIPTLLFADPWGYKGLTLKLINSILKNWGSDCIFFFNYNRINMGVTNPFVKSHMDDLFGLERADKLRNSLGSMTPEDRELCIIEQIAEALKANFGNYVLPFRFKGFKGSKISHHLIYVSKSVLGYDIMKGIMAGQSSLINDGVSSFEYNPADRRYPILFNLSRPLEELGQSLLEKFQGKTITMKEVFQLHNVGTPFIEKNYKAALLQLESEGKIIAEPAKRKKILLLIM
jgi:three-Cys-motif partner protein